MENGKMTDTQRSIEFDKVKERWSDLALTAQAKCRIAEITPFLSEVDLRAALRETSEGKAMMETCGMPPLVSLEDLAEILLAAEKGAALSPEQLEQVEKALVAVKRIRDYLGGGRQYQISLAYYDENLELLSELKEAIHTQIRNGRVDDYASKLLASLRSDINRMQERMKEKAESVIRAHKDCMSDSFCTFRNGRLCVPVKKEYKFKIAGSIIDKSATGSTLFIEPASVSRYYEELWQLKLDEENEERRILYTLSGMVADEVEVMRQNIKTMEKLDFVFSKAKLSMELDAAEPRINTARRIEIAGGRHPLMEREICVPLQFSIGDGVCGIVITGPNTGGKTVALKTVALNCMMAQCGLHVTCGEADICMNSNYLCDIGDGQNLSENLSTFSAHVKNVLSILEHAGRESLVIMDELGSGTDPTEGMGIAIAILEELKNSGCLFLVTTHYPEVKQYAAKTPGILNARMTFDKETLKPLYRMVIGEAGESCAFYIAGRLGMPESMLRTAVRAAYGEAAVETYRFLQQKDAGEKPAAEHEPFGEDRARADTTKIIKKKRQTAKGNDVMQKFSRGDSVMVYPDKKLGIVCRTVNERGVLQVQLPGKKIWINHKRVKLHVAAAELYPEDYDFSIIFDTVENRKLRHEMERKYVEDAIVDSPF